MKILIKKPVVILAVSSFFGMLGFSSTVFANQYYAERFNENCSSCHLTDRQQSINTLNDIGKGVYSCRQDQSCIRDKLTNAVRPNVSSGASPSSNSQRSDDRRSPQSSGSVSNSSGTIENRSPKDGSCLALFKIQSADNQGFSVERTLKPWSKSSAVSLARGRYNAFIYLNEPSSNQLKKLVKSFAFQVGENDWDVSYNCSDDQGAVANNESKTSCESLLKKADAGDSKSQYDAAISLQTGNGCSRDFRRALRYAQAAATAGHAEAASFVGERYYFGNPSVPTDVREAYRWFSAGAKRGERSSMMGIGFILATSDVQFCYQIKQLAVADSIQSFLENTSVSDSEHKRTQQLKAAIKKSKVDSSGVMGEFERSIAPLQQREANYSANITSENFMAAISKMGCRG